MPKELSDAGKEDLALALILLKDFKADGKFDPDCVVMMYSLADHLGVRAQLDKLHPLIPPMKITPR